MGKMDLWSEVDGITDEKAGGTRSNSAVNSIRQTIDLIL